MKDKNSNQSGAKKLNNDSARKIKLIKETQGIPEEIVINFIESKGKLILTKNGKLEIVRKIK